MWSLIYIRVFADLATGCGEVEEGLELPFVRCMEEQHSELKPE
jgi:hypothetical protein